MIELLQRGWELTIRFRPEVGFTACFTWRKRDCWHTAPKVEDATAKAAWFAAREQQRLDDLVREREPEDGAEWLESHRWTNPLS